MNFILYVKICCMSLMYLNNTEYSVLFFSLMCFTVINAKMASVHPYMYLSLPPIISKNFESEIICFKIKVFGTKVPTCFPEQVFNLSLP